MKIFTLSLVVVFCAAIGFSPSVYGCTAFYAANSETVLVGNNEDIPDSLAQAWGGTHMWFVPPEDGKYGKVCFGYGELSPYGSHFAQGGMNETGLFLDGFSTPLNEITESLNKPIYDGPLTDKSLDECSTVKEVLQIYDMYNMQAQHMEIYQLMFGDKFGGSAIIEGDAIIEPDKWYQVCTNFYQSSPELGGYPCQRYDSAVEMLENSSEISTEFCRTVLDAVHQEGLASTQYSIIYEPANGVFYVFFYHNFEEFIKIDLQDELAKGPASYDLSSLFADMRLATPYDRSTVASQSVIFKWSGKPDCDYQLYYSESPGFAGSDPIALNGQPIQTANTGYPPIILAGLLPLGLAFRKKRVHVAVLLVILAVLMVSCNNGCDDDAMSINIQSLKPDTTYYWKVTAQASDNFVSESVVRTFITQGK